mmetsp:Transcript_16153/g.38312  ORF Transcript_16153/g.38312 Transcript_16153/m.38312 type:complete len:302 (+) Transcript_16153:96-1001(+)
MDIHSALESASPPVIAALIRQHLADFGYVNSLKQFQIEASGLLNLWDTQTGSSCGRVKDLSTALSEYVSLWERERKFWALASSNHLAADLYALLDRHATQSLSGPPPFSARPLQEVRGPFELPLASSVGNKRRHSDAPPGHGATAEKSRAGAMRPDAEGAVPSLSSGAAGCPPGVDLPLVLRQQTAAMSGLEEAVLHGDTAPMPAACCCPPVADAKGSASMGASRATATAIPMERDTQMGPGRERSPAGRGPSPLGEARPPVPSCPGAPSGESQPPAALPSIRMDQVEAFLASLNYGSTQE